LSILNKSEAAALELLQRVIPVPPAEQAGGLKPNELLRRHLYRLQVLVELEQLQRKDLMKVCVLYTLAG